MGAFLSFLIFATYEAKQDEEKLESMDDNVGRRCYFYDECLRSQITTKRRSDDYRYNRNHQRTRSEVWLTGRFF